MDEKEKVQSQQRGGARSCAVGHQPMSKMESEECSVGH